MQVDENDMPSIKLTIYDAEVLWNPFDDLQPRVDKEDKKAAREEAEAAAKLRSAKLAFTLVTASSKHDIKGLTLPLLLLL